MSTHIRCPNCATEFQLRIEIENATPTLDATPPTDRMLSCKEVAEIYGVSATTLRRWRKGGIGPRWERCGGKPRYHPIDVSAVAMRANARK
jgi:hypothetical protein